MRKSIAGLALTMMAAAPLAAGAGGSAITTSSIFDFDRARTFCAAGPEGELEDCLNQQQRAANRIDFWLVRGELPRYLAKRTYKNCDIRYGPDYRRTLRCVEDIEDNRRDGRGALSGRGIVFGR